MKLRTSLSMLALVVAAGLVQAQDAAAPDGPPPAPVQTALAERAQFAPVLWSPGGVVSREDSRVASELAGRVVQVAEVGTELKRGAVIARLDDSMLRLKEQDDVANVRRIEAQLDYARKQEQRYIELARQNTIAATQLDLTRSERQVLEQDLARAKVTLAQTRQQRDYAVVHAPFDGVVAERFVQAGEFVGVGAPVLRLVNTGSLEVSARAPVALAAQLKAGLPVSVRWDDRLVQARLRSVVPLGDQASRQLEVRVALPAGDWPIGAAVQVALPSAAPRAAVAVPRDALLLRKEGAFVVKVGADDRTQRISVQTGASRGELVEVQGEVMAGDRLVVRGGERLQVGQRVTVANRAVASVPGVARGER
ncbi:efflux RND transporter periplasmic adaptor subunit [Arenimonas terrae]|uniref:Efflux RND transporter periplasmic adaptor subunit n=1 Tax=Arenimonas terrae TaxID=2546226 RepID=A0A5C4RRF3_9GAMM|nr:efflux RND transporter periplasmic adaptor subunit [Arenimonas terrae]TNJ33519.1 efflux RND transporter periplasmic adaptor subunit [Arenimonas terrae]